MFGKLYSNNGRYQPEPIVDRPLQRLAGALLIQAIEDVTHPTYSNQARGWLE